MQEIKRFVLAASALGLVACTNMTPPGRTAEARVQPTQGQTVNGTVKFRGTGDVLAVVVRLQGLPPNSSHGFHLHETGDCSAPDAMSTGGHYNPTAKPHGPQSADHHAGDMPMLVADATGSVDANFELRGVSIGEGPANIVGRGLIVHGGPDDYTTQPTGNSGNRIGCGVVARTS